MKFEWYSCGTDHWCFGIDGDQFALADIHHHRNASGVYEWDDGSTWEWYILGKWYANSFAATLEEAQSAAEKALREVAEQILREVGVPA